MVAMLVLICNEHSFPSQTKPLLHVIATRNQTCTSKLQGTSLIRNCPPS